MIGCSELGSTREAENFLVQISKLIKFDHNEQLGTEQKVEDKRWLLLIGLPPISTYSWTRFKLILQLVLILVYFTVLKTDFQVK